MLRVPVKSLPVQKVSRHVMPPDEVLYAMILQELGIVYREKLYWLCVGENNWTENKDVVYISSMVHDMAQVLYAVAPVLQQFNVCFKVVRSSYYHYQLNGGHFGSGEIGKAIVFALQEGMDATFWQLLLPMLKDNKGPSPLVDCYKVGSCCYVAPATTQPAWMRGLPARKIVYPVTHKMIGWYVPVQMLKYSPKGNVYKGYSLRMQACLIKEGRQYMAEDAEGRTVKDRLQWESQVLFALQGKMPVPKLYRYLKKNGDAFLVQEFIEGKPLAEITEPLRKAKLWQELKLCFVEVIGLVERLHALGFVHRDLNENNFIARCKGGIYLVDFEIAFPLHEANPGPQEDVYSVGVLLACGFTGELATVLHQYGRDKIKGVVINRTGDKGLATLIHECLHPVPAKRPRLSSLLQYLQL